MVFNLYKLANQDLFISQDYIIQPQVFHAVVTEVFGFQTSKTSSYSDSRTIQG